ncbi:unnamed protein product [Lactuca saligna]|uniref:Uncharacterized protein n=1 Tax=Lactuca saligna TaxID=75948 RepID=A0AA36ELK5_LACSI|nr:unnamed protein product [Lactuca saligna]
MVLSSDKETESDNVGLHPRKRQNTVFVPKLLGVIGDVLGDGFSAPGWKEIVVVPSSSKTSPSPFIDLLTTDPSVCSVLGGALGVSGGFPSSEIPYMVEKMRTTSHPVDSKAYVPGWAVTKDSLLSEDIATWEWSYYTHPSATMKLLAAQLGVHMAGDLRYAATQTSTHMVAAADRFCRHGINETQLKTSQDGVASLWGEFRYSEAECRRLSKKYYIVA